MNNNKNSYKIFKYLISSNGDSKIGWINKCSKKEKKNSFITRNIKHIISYTITKKKYIRI